MDSIEVTAKKVDEAIKEGLKQLEATIDDVDVSVLDSGGFFRKAKIRMTLCAEVQAARDKIREQLLAEEREEQEREKRAQAAKEAAERKAQERENAKPKSALNRTASAGEQTEKKEYTAAPNRAENGGRRAANDFKQKDARKDKPQQQPAKQTSPDVVKVVSEEDRAQAQAREAERRKKAEEQRQAALAEPSQVAEEKTTALKGFVENVLRLMGVTETKTELCAHGRDVDVTLHTDDGVVIGYRGETLDAIEYLAGLAVNKDSEKYIRVSLDCNSYRNKREESLVRLAEKMAAKCVKTNRKVALEPMNSASRKVIHAALSDNEKITTKSEGKEPNRRVVIYCKRDNTRAPQQ